MNSQQKISNMVLAAVFTALIIVMSFTPLGYLRVGFVSISFMTIPVAIGAILLGPVYGAYFGLLFGITSFIQCFTGDLFGASLVAINPAFTAVMCIIPRICIGLVCGFIAKAIKKSVPAFLTASMCAPLTNTALFMGFMMILFYNNPEFHTSLASLGIAGYTNLWSLLWIMIGVNGIIEFFVCGIVSFGIASPLSHAFAHLQRSK
ncbi:MAG: ECF transporter S component [Clostridia bacterium]|nr:ECF transporter S component [Clostridia bacterium]